MAGRVAPALSLLEPERAHGLGLLALRAGLVGASTQRDAPILACAALGLRFANPIGLAAGFDKDAVAVQALARLGFGFVETGTVTPLPQPGNPRPRMFRLREDAAVINRMGFNNNGLDAYVAKLRAAFPSRTCPIGANVGPNKDAADPARDYGRLIAAVGPHADYVAINVSSPNTPGLRDLQAAERLAEILAAVRQTAPGHPPLLVKIAPDLSDAALAALIEACVAGGAAGLIVSNTTIGRPTGLRGRAAAEAGGLSGTPLFARSTAVLARAFLLARGRLVLVGAGGVGSGRDVLTKLRAGASLVQLYTAFAYAGPALIPRIKSDLVAAMRADGLASIAAAIGVDAERLAGSAGCDT